MLPACGPGDGPSDVVRGELIVFTGSEDCPNGAWCWFQDERAIVDARHPDGSMLMFTAISASDTDSTEMGDLDLHFYGLESGRDRAEIRFGMDPQGELYPLQGQRGDLEDGGRREAALIPILFDACVRGIISLLFR